MGQFRAALHIGRNLVAVALRQVDIGQDNIWWIGVETLDRQLPVPDRRDFNVLIGKRELDDALNRDTVVGQEKLMRHPDRTSRGVLSAGCFCSLSF